jgi:endonuclease/exonuclease/phosphatase family metal-dependent hydrolase
MSMKCVTWNVLAQAYCHPERYPQGEEGWDDALFRFDWTVATVGLLGSLCDVVFLQEVDEALGARLSTEFGAAFGYVRHPRRQDGVGVLSNFAVRRMQTISVSEMAAVGLWVMSESGPVTVVSTHLGWSEDGLKGAAQLEALSEYLDEEAGPCVIGMDANAPWSSNVCEALRTRGWLASEERHSALVDGVGWQALDVIAVSSGVVGATSVMGPTGVVASLTWPSDHYALLADVEVRA